MFDALQDDVITQVLERASLKTNLLGAFPIQAP